MTPMTAEQGQQVSLQESGAAAAVPGRPPQGTLAWDPEYVEYLLWLAGRSRQP